MTAKTTRSPRATERQQQVIDLLSDGLTVKEAAQELGISTNAVYLQITKLRNRGLLPRHFTATGRQTREIASAPGSAALERILQAAAPSEVTTPELGARALVQELVRTRDELLEAAARITAVLPPGV
jgi:transposase